jgi:hypothetical protein
MPLIQGGPPEWIWERTAEVLKTSLVPVESPQSQTVYELRVDCGMEIVRLQFLTREELEAMGATIADVE